MRRTILLAAFLVAAAATAVFGLRLVGSALYWSAHRDAPIEAWMTVGMVARSHDVPRDVVAAAAGVPTGERDRRPLAEIALDEGVPAADLIGRVERAIAAHRAAEPRGGGTRPP